MTTLISVFNIVYFTLNILGPENNIFPMKEHVPIVFCCKVKKKKKKKRECLCLFLLVLRRTVLRGLLFLQSVWSTCSYSFAPLYIFEKRENRRTPNFFFSFFFFPPQQIKKKVERISDNDDTTTATTAVDGVSTKNSNVTQNRFGHVPVYLMRGG